MKRRKLNESGRELIKQTHTLPKWSRYLSQCTGAKLISKKWKESLPVFNLIWSVSLLFFFFFFFIKQNPCIPSRALHQDQGHIGASSSGSSSHNRLIRARNESQLTGWSNLHNKLLLYLCLEEVCLLLILLACMHAMLVVNGRSGS